MSFSPLQFGGWPQKTDIEYSPANVLCKQLGPKIWLATITFAFGIITMCISFTRSKGGLVAARVFLGMAEAGIMPGITYALSTL